MRIVWGNKKLIKDYSFFWISFKGASPSSLYSSSDSVGLCSWMFCKWFQWALQDWFDILLGKCLPEIGSAVINTKQIDWWCLLASLDGVMWVRLFVQGVLPHKWGLDAPRVSVCPPPYVSSHLVKGCPTRTNLSDWKGDPCPSWLLSMLLTAINNNLYCYRLI